MLQNTVLEVDGGQVEINLVDRAAEFPEIFFQAPVEVTALVCESNFRLLPPHLKSVLILTDYVC